MFGYIIICRIQVHLLISTGDIAKVVKGLTKAYKKTSSIEQIK